MTAPDIWPDEAIEAMHLASLALLERAGSGSSRRPPGSSSWRPAAGLRRRPRARPAGRGRRRLAACPASYALAARDPRVADPDAEPGVTYVHNMGGAATSSTRAPGAGTARDGRRPGPRLPRHAPAWSTRARSRRSGSPTTCPTRSSRSTRTSCSRSRPTRPSAAPASRTRSRRGTSRRWPRAVTGATAPTASTRSTSPSRR